MRVGEHEYKGIKVWYNSDSETWECFLERTRMPEINNARITSIYGSIDNFLKEEKHFDRFETFVISGRFGVDFEQRTVTTRQDNGFYWTVDKDGNRNKENGRNLIEITPENGGIVDSVKALRIEASDLVDKALKMLDKITVVPRG